MGLYCRICRVEFAGFNWFAATGCRALKKVKAIGRVRNEEVKRMKKDMEEEVRGSD